MFERPEAGERAILVHVVFKDGFSTPDFDEFTELAGTAGATPVATVGANRDRPDPRYFIGSGKAEELRALVLAHEADQNRCKTLFFEVSSKPAHGARAKRSDRCEKDSVDAILFE